jgi:cell envelope opacity-associated protein A
VSPAQFVGHKNNYFAPLTLTEVLAMLKKEGSSLFSHSTLKAIQHALISISPQGVLRRITLTT